MNYVRPLVSVCLLLSFVITVAARPQDTRERHIPACGSWDLVYSPSGPKGSSFLTAVAHVPGTVELWSVGHYINLYWLTLIEHWDGTTWQVVATPNHPTANHYLYAAAAVASDDVWVVGEYEPPGGGRSTLTLHWDGTSWSIIPSPNPAVYNGLYAVAATSPTDVWAVGYYYTQSAQQTLIEHWDGTSWSIVSSPNVGTGWNLLRAVTVVPNPQQDLWAVGYYYRDDGNPSTLVQQWNGTIWSVVPSPDGSTRENYLTGVSSTAPNDAWAVGYYNTPTGLYLPLTEHWDGTSWQVVPSPSLSPSLTAPTAVSSTSAKEVWAVGSYFNENAAQLTLAQQWDGTSWQVFTTPNPAGTDSNEAINVFTSVANVPGVGVWAVGYYQRLGTPAQTLTAFYCPVAGPTPTPTPTPITTATPTPSGTATVPPTATPAATATPRPRPTPRSHPAPPPRP
jgi:hypothetical protein